MFWSGGTTGYVVSLKWAVSSSKTTENVVHPGGTTGYVVCSGGTTGYVMSFSGTTGYVVPYKVFSQL